MVERTGFWRRGLAFVIDGLLVAVALEIVAFAAFPLSNGHIQASLGFQHTTCQKLTAPPPEFAVPPEFEANFAFNCRGGLFGLPTARTTTIGRATREGNVTKSIQLTLMVDEQGKPIRGLSLNLLLFPLLIALRWWADQRKGSPGRRVCRMSVMNVRDRDAPPSTSAISRRYAAFVLPSIPALLVGAYYVTFLSFENYPGPMLFPILIGIGFIAGLPALWAIIAIVSRQDAFYDLFAGTTVIRNFAPKPGT